MTIKTDIDEALDAYPELRQITVGCTPRGGLRIFGGPTYRGRQLIFVGESRATKLRKEAERERSFKEAQQDAFQSSVSNEGPQV